MALDPEQAHALLPYVDPGHVHNRLPVGLRDGAILALVATGLNVQEIAGLLATSISMEGGRLRVTLERRGKPFSFTLTAELGSRLLAWISERRLWGLPKPVFPGIRGPLTAQGVYHVLTRYCTRRPTPARRRRPLVR